MVHMTTFKTLYAKTKAGDTKCWNVRTDGANIIVEYGKLGGKQQKKITTAKSKNVGKANETSPEDQAIAEALSKWTKKKERENYVEDPNNFSALFFPTLAQDYKKFKDRCCKRIMKLNRAFFTQPKLDGVRAFYEDGMFMSRKRTEYSVMQWMAPSASKLRNNICDILGVHFVVLDGEFWLRGILRQDISGAAKSKKDLTEKLQFHVFDFYTPELPDLTFEQRDAVMRKCLLDLSGNIHLVPTMRHEIWTTAEEIDKILMNTALEYKEDGFEGGIGRVDEPYEVDARSNSLWKCKYMVEDDFEIIDVIEKKPHHEPIDPMVAVACDRMVMIAGEPYAEYRQGVFKIKLKNGLTTEVTPAASREFKRDIVINPQNYIGKPLTTQYQGFTKDGDLEFAVGLEVRDDI